MFEGINGLGDRLFESAKARVPNVRNFLEKTRSEQRENARLRRLFLNGFRQDLSKNTASLLSNFHNDGREGVVSESFGNTRDFLASCHQKQQGIRQAYERARFNFSKSMRGLSKYYEEEVKEQKPE